jgi:hypothetical protein
MKVQPVSYFEKSLLTIVLSLGSLFGGEQKELYLWQNHGVLVRKLLFSPEEFNLTRLEKFFRDSISEADPRFNLVKISVTVDDANSNAKGLDEYSYELWSDFYPKISKNVPPVAELLIFNRGAVMRVRDLEGKVHHLLLKGSDPLTFETKNYRFEILWVGVSRRSGDNVNIHFFVVGSPPLLVEQASEATRALSRLLKNGDVSVSLRTDSWFIKEFDFPLIYPFATRLGPAPSSVEYKRSAQTHCWLIGDEMFCRSTNVNVDSK